MIRIWATVLLFLPVLGAFDSARAQAPILNDDRAYSSATSDRAYIAARCAALYTELAQFALDQDRAFANTKTSEAKEFLKRVVPPLESVFLEWSTQYRAQLARPEDPATSSLGKDINACAGVLALIRKGDNMSNYNRDELKYLMGG